MIDDTTLLKSYARDRAEEAFGEIVRRHLPLVYSAAVRRTDGDAHRAKDVAQIVFSALARDAAALSRHPALTGWLYTATRNAAIDLMRAERRRQKREEEALTMEQMASSSETPADWEQLRPVLDDVMDELDGPDREAVLLRFFEGRPLAAVAAALRVSEDAARKRVDRALDKLGAQLARRGITSTGGALAVLLANQVAVAAPAGVAASITTAALAGAAAGAGGAGAAGIFIMSISKAVMGITAVVALVAIGTAVYQAGVARDALATVAATSAERDTLRTQLGTRDQGVRLAAAQLAATQKELSDARARAPEPAPAARPAVTQGAAMDYVLEHPETHAAYVQQQGLRLKTRYDRFFKTAGLSAEQQDGLLKALEGRAGDQLDLMAALHAQGFGVGNVPQDPEGQRQFQQILSSDRQHAQAVQSEMRALLGDDGFRQFAQYSATIAERNVADQLASRLYYTAEPLSAGQAEQLAQVLAKNRLSPQPTPSPATNMNGTLIDQPTLNNGVAQAMQQGGMNLLDWQAPVSDAALAQAQAVLTPAQFAVLKQVQAQQVAQLQLAPPPPGQKNAAAASSPAGK